MAKKYRVTGRTAYRGNEPRKTFTAELSKEEEERAVARGAIKVVQSKGEDQDKSD